MTKIELFEQTAADLEEYLTIPIVFEVRTIFDIQIIDQGLGGFRLQEREHESPYILNYDHLEKPEWDKKWDISNWLILSAFLDGVHVGGCVVAYDTPGIYMLAGRKDVVALWDIRIDPAYRRQGIGSKLFQASINWARKRNCRLFKAETQNINVPACRFYARQGCVLGRIDRHIYADYPDQVELVWCKELT
ncbi:MAG: GNAT family N-acetyltransferase [Sedimentisphaerales bacterium]|nr:GNAT family N-acetyltransferase [Sedimentisphaerales bacterium]